MTDDLPDSETPPGIPRWVKALVLAGIIVMLLVIGGMLIIGGDHGPDSHVPGLLPGSTLLADYLGPMLSAAGAATTTGGDTPSVGGPG